MTTLDRLYRPALALVQDLYQLTMAYGYWKSARDLEATFHLYFRRNPFQGGYAVACGLSQALEFIDSFRFQPDDVEYLATLTGADGRPLFEPDFLRHLADLRLSVDVDAVPEGTTVFQNEPLVRVSGSALECQLLETPLLNLINFQTLVATKAARVCHAAQGDPVIEFGLRRAQGIDGGVGASRAAYVGGCSSTSNVLAGRLYGIPVRGTHAHSWVMLFGDELDAFRRYADALPNNCVFLVDTYDTLDGVRHAVRVGRELRERGHELQGVRLDSGDLAALSIEARKILDDGGFPNATIVASSDLDEQIIASLKQQGAKIGVWGVGTKLATAYDQPALGGVYKLTAARRRGEPWQHRIKVSDNAVKTTTPGLLQVRRFVLRGEAIGDMLYDELTGPGDERRLVSLSDATRIRKIPAEATFHDLLAPVVRQGRVVAPDRTVHEVREFAARDLALFPSSIKRFVNAHEYPTGLSPALHALRTRMVREARGD